jgi:hypothetical protein
MPSWRVFLQKALSIVLRLLAFVQTEKVDERLSPESIVDSFETLALEQVYGAIAYYLGNKASIDAYLKQSEAEFDEFCRQAREAHPFLYQKLDDARRRRSGEAGHEGAVSS